MPHPHRCIDKIDSETKQRIKGNAEFKIFEWDTVRQCYIPNGGYETTLGFYLRQ